ncbi:uncharacterized protein TNCV_4448101 [Trichonephila clavipes]|nr:uncharacterized protein TNCV_4448101 [Trichonephila clavipes]
MARRKGLNPDEIANLLRKISENESDGGELSCSNLDSNKNIRLSESDYGESEESADIIDNIPVNSDIYISLRMPQNGYCIIVMFLADLRLEMFCDKAVVQQASRKIISTSVFYDIKSHKIC